MEQLLTRSVNTCHVPEELQNQLRHYFVNFKLCFTVSDYTTSWKRFEVKKVTGCIISSLQMKTAEMVSSLEHKKSVIVMQQQQRKQRKRSVQ